MQATHRITREALSSSSTVTTRSQELKGDQSAAVGRDFELTVENNIRDSNAAASVPFRLPCSRFLASLRHVVESKPPPAHPPSRSPPSLGQVGGYARTDWRTTTPMLVALGIKRAHGPEPSSKRFSEQGPVREDTSARPRVVSVLCHLSGLNRRLPESASSSLTRTDEDAPRVRPLHQRALGGD